MRDLTLDVLPPKAQARIVLSRPLAPDEQVVFLGQIGLTTEADAIVVTNPTDQAQPFAVAVERELRVTLLRSALAFTLSLRQGALTR